MSRLIPPTRGPMNGVPPSEADATKVLQYINNARWHLKYLNLAFASDGQKQIAKLLSEALTKVDEARELWKNGKRPGS